MSQLVRLEGKHTTQNAHCAVNYREFQSIAEYCRVLQGITGYHRVLQSIAEYCRVLQSVTECYRILAHPLGPTFWLVSQETVPYISDQAGLLYLIPIKVDI